MDIQTGDENYRETIKAVLNREVLAQLSKPGVEEIKLERMNGFSNIVFKAVTDQGTFIAKFTKSTPDNQFIFHPPHIRPLMN